MAAMMTALQALQLTVQLANAALLHQIAAAETLLYQLGASERDVKRALGEPDGFMRKMLVEDRDLQIAEVERWLAGVTLY
jgi:hypothetical protein